MSPRIVTSHQNSNVHKRNEVSNHVHVVKKWWLKQKKNIDFGGEPLKTPKHKQQQKSKTEKKHVQPAMFSMVIMQGGAPKIAKLDQLGLYLTTNY